jgi:deoxyribodipyrimidine photo-lyase
MIYFPTDIKSIVERVHAVDANAYAKTSNFLAGAVTYLSPYISRGVISLPFIQKIILEKYSKFASEKLIQELAWREYYQRVWLFPQVSTYSPSFFNYWKKCESYR